MAELEIKRSELKYYINRIDTVFLEKRLPLVLSLDPYSSNEEGYHIRSLYFDSLDDECLSDKQAGRLRRRKYRLRIYGPESEVVKFEIKHKVNNQVFKETALVSRNTAKEMIAGDFSSMLSYENPLLHRAYAVFIARRYSPKVVVDYHRKAFVYPHFNIRITLDRNLRSNCSDFDIFSSKLATIPVVLEGKQILEVKYDKVLPDVIRDIAGLTRHERMAISKYTLSRRFLKTRKWEDN